MLEKHGFVFTNHLGLLYKQVQLEKLAAMMGAPIKFESRRRQIQRFLSLPKWKVKVIWFPIVKHLLKELFKRLFEKG